MLIFSVVPIYSRDFSTSCPCMGESSGGIRPVVNGYVCLVVELRITNLLANLGYPTLT